LAGAAIVTQLETEEAKAEKPAEPSSQAKRRGFMTGQVTVPEDFDQMAAAEIEQMFAQPIRKV
jgi:hypothetical protein